MSLVQIKFPPFSAKSVHLSVNLPAASHHDHDAAAYALHCHSLRDQLCRGTFLTQDSQEQMLRADVVVIEGTSLLLRQLQDLERLLILCHACSPHRPIPFLSLQQGVVAQGPPTLDAHVPH